MHSIYFLNSKGIKYMLVLQEAFNLKLLQPYHFGYENKGEA